MSCLIVLVACPFIFCVGMLVGKYIGYQVGIKENKKIEEENEKGDYGYRIVGNGSLDVDPLYYLESEAWQEMMNNPLKKKSK